MLCHFQALPRARTASDFRAPLNLIAAMPPPQTFHRFAELPRELQTQIWEYAFNDEDLHNKRSGNIFTFLASPGMSPYETFVGPWCRTQLRYNGPVCRLIRVCRLSRYTAFCAWRKTIWGARSSAGWSQELKENILEVLGELADEAKARLGS